MNLKPATLSSHKLSRSIAAGVAAVALAVGGYAIADAGSTATAASPSAPAAGRGPTGGLGGGGRSNPRSGPAAGGASGAVAAVATSRFTLSTSAGQKVTVDETSSTRYLKGTSSTSASAVIPGEHVLVLGATSGTTITAMQVLVQPAGGGSATSSQVIPFQPGAATTSKQVGQIPGNYRQGSGTIVSGTTANKATKAALAAYPGGIVDRVVQLSNGEYEVHNIGVNWPHHIFVNKIFTVVGAD